MILLKNLPNISGESTIPPVSAKENLTTTFKLQEKAFEWISSLLRIKFPVSLPLGFHNASLKSQIWHNFKITS